MNIPKEDWVKGEFRALTVEEVRERALVEIERLREEASVAYDEGHEAGRAVAMDVSYEAGWDAGQAERTNP